MSRRLDVLRLAQIVGAVVALGCSSEDGSRAQGAPPLEAADASRADDGAVSESASETSGCAAVESALLELIDANRSCTRDSDCQQKHSVCLFQGRVHCSSGFFVNRSIDEETFEQLDSELRRCSAPETCGACAGGPALIPICKDGICLPDPEACGGLCYVPGDADYSVAPGVDAGVRDGGGDAPVDGWPGDASSSDDASDAQTIGRPVDAAGAADDGGDARADATASTCEALCEKAWCGVPFSDPCRESCVSALAACSPAEVIELGACRDKCDILWPCITDVACVQ